MVLSSLFFYHFFHNSAHMLNPLFVFLELSDSFSQKLVFHIIGLFAVKIMHQVANRIISFVFTINIYDMAFVVKWYITFFYSSFNGRAIIFCFFAKSFFARAVNSGALRGCVEMNFAPLEGVASNVVRTRGRLSPPLFCFLLINKAKSSE